MNLVQVDAIEESGTSVLFTFCFEETIVYRGNSGEARAGVFLCVVDHIGLVFVQLSALRLLCCYYDFICEGVWF